jgi:quinoprotein relay system zinc metallohydrolase 2
MQRDARTILAAFVLLLTDVPAAKAADVAALPVTEVAPGVFVHAAPISLARPSNEGAIANAGFVVGRDAVAVIDTEGSETAGRRLLAAVRAKTGLPIRYVVNTHVHPDHLLGNAAFAGEGAAFVGHRNLPEALAARGPGYLGAARDLLGADAVRGTRLVSPTRLVADRLDLDLGDRRLVVEAWPTAHTNADLTVLDEATGTWFLGDLLFAGHVPALDGRISGWLSLLERLEKREAKRVVPGHGPAAMPWPEAVRPTRRYLEALRRDVRGLIRAGRTIGEAAGEAGRSEAGAWELFEDFNARNATTAYQELEWE